MALPPVAALNSAVPGTSAEGGVITIKEERPDEAEIQELAARMVEANKIKMAAQAAVAAVGSGGRPPGSQGGGILSYLQRRPVSSPAPTSTTPILEEEPDKIPVDINSQKGKFSWLQLGEEYLPFIHRNDDAYCAVRIIEMKLLAKYLSYLNPEIYQCTCIRSFYVTEAEARLLNEINLKHCEAKYGRDTFTTKDLIVKKQDAAEFYSFLELCYNKLVTPVISQNSRCGFVRINNDSVVPYTMKERDKYVPLFYFEGETEMLKQKSTSLGSWDLAYLKFCCKVQGIRSELFANDSCTVISLDDIKNYFPPGTLFEEFWPPKIGPDNALLMSNKHARSGVLTTWIKAPVGATSPVSSDSRVSSSNQMTNGWSNTTITSAGRYPAQSLPSSAQTLSQRVAGIDYRAVASTNNRGYSQSRVQSNNLNQYYTSTAHGTLPSLAPSTSVTQVPPLVRVSSANPLTYYSTTGDVIDLSSPPHSPQRSLMMNGKTPQPAPAHQASRQASQSQKANSSEWSRLIPIPEAPAKQTNHFPFKMQKALVNGKMVPCINAKPYVYSELLMTVNDLLDFFFPGVSMAKCREVLQNVLQVTLYSGNLAQKSVLKDNNKCKTLNETLPLIQLKDVMQYMPQLKYVMGRQMSGSGESSPKRARIS